MSRRKLFGLAAGLAAALGAGALAGGGPRAAAAEPEAGKGKRAAAFVAAFNKGDAKAVAAFWTPDGDYVDPLGRETKGRAAIEKLYEKAFAGRKGATLTVVVTSARLVGTDVALEDGITDVRPADGGPSSPTRFSAVLVKKDGEWYFESLRESVAHPPSNADKFGDLGVLIGTWTGEAEKGESGRATYSWAENRNFIVSSFAATVNGVPVVGGTQWIGWDAVAKQVRSWSFYSTGGVGEAVWTKDGGAWATKITAHTADGKTVTGTNTLTVVDADRISWQMSNVTVDGKPQPAPPPLKLKRVKP